MPSKLQAYVDLSGCMSTCACQPCPHTAVCSLFRKPRTVCPMLDDHKLFAKIETDYDELAAPA